MENVVATPHIGFVSQGLYRTLYQDTVNNIAKWLEKRP
jgi:phosphoglycerate dehydrogenase-like enzyme